MPVHPEEFDLGAPHHEPHIFMQLKGTDICMDFYCECGAACHYDGYFASRVKCPHCQQEWVLPMILFPRKPTDDDFQHEAQVMEPDDDHVDHDGRAVPVTNHTPREQPNG